MMGSSLFTFEMDWFYFSFLVLFSVPFLCTCRGKLFFIGIIGKSTWHNLFSLYFELFPWDISALERGLFPVFRWWVNVIPVKLTKKFLLNIERWICPRINCSSLTFVCTQWCINLTLKGLKSFESSFCTYASKYFNLMKYYIKLMLYDFL